MRKVNAHSEIVHKNRFLEKNGVYSRNFVRLKVYSIGTVAGIIRILNIVKPKIYPSMNLYETFFENAKGGLSFFNCD